MTGIDDGDISWSGKSAGPVFNERSSDHIDYDELARAITRSNRNAADYDTLLGAYARDLYSGAIDEKTAFARLRDFEKRNPFR